MNRENAIYYLQSSGFSEEQISEIEQGFKDEPCEDCISRQAAIGIIQNWLDYNIGYSCGEKIVMLCTIGELKDLPSVSAEKTGRWIESNGVGMFICSVCNNSFYPMPTCLGKPLMKYCPNCGCRMVEPKESEEE